MCGMFPFTCNYRNINQSIVTESRSLVWEMGWEAERGKKERLQKSSRKLFKGDVYIHYLDCGNYFMKVYISKYLSDRIR